MKNLLEIEVEKEEEEGHKKRGDLLVDEIAGQGVDEEEAGGGAEGKGEEVAKREPFDGGDVAVVGGEGWADLEGLAGERGVGVPVPAEDEDKGAGGVG